jgi:hypothetical protein
VIGILCALLEFVARVLVAIGIVGALGLVIVVVGRPDAVPE